MIARVLRALRVALAGILASAAAPAVAAAAPTIAATTSCAYSGERFAVAGRGFEPGARVTLGVPAIPGPPGAPQDGSRMATADARGAFLEILDVPPAAGSVPVVRTISARSPDDLAGAALATAPLRTVERGVQVSRETPVRAGATQRWQLTGLPEGTRLYAHWRRAGRTIARETLGSAADPCGRLRFELRVLPRGHERPGAWEVWMTADRTFRRPRKGVYVRRRMTAGGATSRARVRAAAPAARLTPLDPRFSAPVTNGMAADASRLGVISLSFVGAEGAPVEFLERVGDRLVRLGTSVAGADVPVTVLADATTWSCERTERRFVATATLPSGLHALATYGVRTPSCSGRFELGAPRRAGRSELVRVRISDRWGIGAIEPRLCIAPPRERADCQGVRLRRAVTVAGRRFRARRSGDWVVTLHVRDRRVARTVVRVGRGGPSAGSAPPTVLATGDSTMQGIDGFLADELGDAATVVSDVRIGTGLSKTDQPALPATADPSAVQWALLAGMQVARERPSATVVSLGAAEGFEMTTPGGARVQCCDAPWTAEYSRRLQVVMAAYQPAASRRRLLWLTLPLPREERRIVVTRVVNEAILAAAAARRGVEVLRMDLLFTPEGYRNVMRFRGSDVDVRDVDGVHLSVAGTAIAAKVIAEKLRSR